MKRMTPARIGFLKQASEKTGVYAIQEYAPAKWAFEQGYVSRQDQKYGALIWFITDAGKAALLRSGEA